jgi:hypothetical protein
MASDLLFCSGARTRTWDLRVMSFAPGEGAAETISMLPRLPVVPRYSRARMSSMARSKRTICQSRRDVNTETSLDRTGLRWRSAAFVADRSGVDQGLLLPHSSSPRGNWQGETQPEHAIPGKGTDVT